MYAHALCGGGEGGGSYWNSCIGCAGSCVIQDIVCA